ncbi:MAG: MFS transporter [Dehalococcoidia bacterium]
MATGAGEPQHFVRRSFESNIRRFYAFSFLNNFCLWIPIWVLYLIEYRGLSLLQVTVLEAVFHGIVCLAEMPTGAIADRFGRKTSMLMGSVGIPIAMVVFGLADSFLIIVVAYAFWAIAYALYSGADSAFIYDSLASNGREDQFSRVMGRMRAFSVTAAIGASLIGAPLAGTTGLAMPFFISAGISAFAGLLVLTFREPQRHEDHPKLKYFQILRAATSHARQTPQIRTMIALYAVLVASAMSMFIMIQPYLSGHGVEVSQMGLFIIAAQVMAIGGALSAHRIAGTLGERGAFIGVTLLLGGSFFVLAAVPSLLAFGAFGLLFFANSAFLPLSFGYVSRHSPQHLRATLVSIGSMCASLAVVVSQPVFGLMADMTSIEGAFALSGVVVLGFGIPALFAWSTAARGRYEEPVAMPVGAVVAVD